MTLTEATEIRSRIAAERGLLPRLTGTYRAECEATIADLNARLARYEWL
jgi:hypothetical protein